MLFYICEEIVSGMEEGMKEPIVIDIKTCRTGLGHKTQEEEKKKQRNAMLQKHMAARAKTQVSSSLSPLF